MLEKRIEEYAFYHEEKQAFYGGKFSQELIALLKGEEFADTEKMTLPEIVEYTQANFLIKKDKPLPHIQSQQELHALFDKYKQTVAQPLTGEMDYAVILGMSVPANLFKRIFYFFDAFTAGNATIHELIVLGNDEPYSMHTEVVKNIIKEHPQYFPTDLAEKVPPQATMRQIMLFLLHNLKWPAGKLPPIITLPVPYPGNTNDEASAVANYLKNKSAKPNFFQRQPTVVVVSHQPYNDRQGFTFFFALKSLCKVAVAGCGIGTYPALEKYPNATLTLPQDIDNLTKTLYEINQHKDMLMPEIAAKTKQPSPELWHDLDFTRGLHI